MHRPPGDDTRVEEAGAGGCVCVRVSKEEDEVEGGGAMLASTLASRHPSLEGHLSHLILTN